MKLIEGAEVVRIPALRRLDLDLVHGQFDFITGIEGEDRSPEEPVELQLVTALKDGEHSLCDEEYGLRPIPLRAQGIAFGLQQLNWLVSNQDKHAWIADLIVRTNAGIDGPAVTYMDDAGYRRMAYLYLSRSGPGSRLLVGMYSLDTCISCGTFLAAARQKMAVPAC